MRSLVFLCFLSCLAACVRGQAINYLMASYDAAMKMKSYYVYEVTYFREDLTNETNEMVHHFTDLIAEGVASASTPAQGEAIRTCARIAENECRLTIEFVDHYIRAADRTANRLHLTVIDQLSKKNIKEYDLELFYYYHNTLMDKAYEDLNHYYEDMLGASMLIFYEFFYVYEELSNCIDKALLPE